MTCSPDHLARQVREKGFRVTPQRIAILDVLHGAGEHLPATEIYLRVHRTTPGLTEPTVYRTLDFLAQNGLVYVTHLPGGRLEYELARHAHHHLVCTLCGVEQEVSHERFRVVYAELEDITGFRMVESHLTLAGVCPACREQQKEQ